MPTLLRALRVCIVLTVLFLVVNATNIFAEATIKDQHGEARMRIHYDSLVYLCFNMSWEIENASAVLLNSTADVGRIDIHALPASHAEPACLNENPVKYQLDVVLKDGTHQSYRRTILWDQIASRWLFVAISLSILIATFYVSAQIGVLAALLSLGSAWGWILLGMPALPVVTLRDMAIAQVAPEAQVAFFAVVVPGLYWLAKPQWRFSVLLGASIGLLLISAVSTEYLALLSILISLIWAVMPRPSTQKSKPLSRVMIGTVALLLIAFCLGLGFLSQLPRARPANDMLLLISGLCIAVGGLLFLSEKTLRQSTWPYRHVIPVALVGIGFYNLPVLDIFVRHAVDNLTWWIFLVAGTALCLTLCGLVRYRASEAQQRFIGTIAIGLIIITFVLFKWPAYTAAIRVFGFSYIAFRLLHVLLERRLDQPLPAGSLRAFTLYTLFFPAQTVGPIDRWPHFVEELQAERPFSWPETWKAWERILWGAVKKFVIADIVLGHVFPGQIRLEFITPLYAWVQLYVFAFYLYFDFSGFVDIAIGTAQLLGFHLPENFDRPYTRGSLAQFWQSWHMTLSGWLRSYVFLPLSRSLLRTRLKRFPLLIVLSANLVTMSLIGLWHGLTWNFLAWGIWHAVGLFIHKAFADRTRRTQITWRNTWRARAFHVFSVLLTFHFVVLGWVFFAFPGFEDSIRYLAFLIGIRI